MTAITAGPALRRTTALLVLLAAWELLSRVGLFDPFYAPPPSAVGGVMLDLSGGELWLHLGATATAAIATALAIGIVLGFAAALLPRLPELIEPVMILINAIPRVILAPLFVIWLGIGLASKLALATILVAMRTFFAVFNGIKEVDRRLVERVRTLGAARRILPREVYVAPVTAWVLGGRLQGRGGARFHRRRRRRVRRLEPRPRLTPPVPAEHLQGGPHARPDRHHHDVRADALRPRRPLGTPPVALAIRLA